MHMLYSNSLTSSPYGFLRTIHRQLLPPSTVELFSFPFRNDEAVTLCTLTYLRPTLTASWVPRLSG